MEKILFDALNFLNKKRVPDSHKGTFGKVLVIAGSLKFTGACYLCCMAALRSGCGLVTAVIPESVKNIISVLIPEAIVIPVYQTKSGSLSLKALGSILKYTENSNVIALGPGMTLDSSTCGLIYKLVAVSEKPLVIDADALNALSAKMHLLKPDSENVFTPHPAEMSRLTGKTVSKIQSDRREAALEFTQKYGGVLVLKGNRTVVAGSKDKIYINLTGNAGMAAGGTGDILTGIITSLIAQGLDSYSASCLGVYIHGLASDIAVEKTGMISLLPRDILKEISSAFKLALDKIKKI